MERITCWAGSNSETEGNGAIQFSEVLLKWLKFHTGSYCSVNGGFGVFSFWKEKLVEGYKCVSFMQGKNGLVGLYSESSVRCS